MTVRDHLPPPSFAAMLVVHQVQHLTERITSRDRRCRSLAQGLVLAGVIDTVMAGRYTTGPHEAGAASAAFITELRSMLNHPDHSDPACPVAPVITELADLMTQPETPPVAVGLTVWKDALQRLHRRRLEVEFLHETRQLLALRRQLFMLWQPALRYMDLL
ncbi:hypothetical protein [Deinococcus radiotolerans]|uniref:Uncharacterized protein n=1 Tax=Deinococcus radiotolerans TaxID=1309407 RepID=A0ABQ2FH51_9DEIO|nr:hypothetical protein [Deinococcus radiotolerans]GGK91097.1 hypothetical protein GCM10010844_07060 [Deinococcus radiotolerans]